MKKTRIINYILQQNLHEYKGIIIIPIIPINFNLRSVKKIEEFLYESLSAKKKVIKKKEKEIFEILTTSTDELEIKRSFNVLIDDHWTLKISDFYSNIDDEKSNIEKYSKDYKNSVKNNNILGKLTHFIFKYEILLKD